MQGQVPVLEEQATQLQAYPGSQCKIISTAFPFPCVELTTRSLWGFFFPFEANMSAVHGYLLSTDASAAAGSGDRVENKTDVGPPFLEYKV